MKNLKLTLFCVNLVWVLVWSVFIQISLVRRNGEARWKYSQLVTASLHPTYMEREGVRISTLLVKYPLKTKSDFLSLF